MADPRQDREKRELPITPEWQAAIEDLGLEWSTQFVRRTDIETCQIISDPVAQAHEIRLHPNALRNPELFRVDVYHELCHGSISERVDPAFSTMYFPREYGESQGDAAEQAQRRMQMAYWSWAHVDIWINELRHEHWPELTKEDQASYISSVARAAKAGMVDVLRRPDQIVALSMNMAEKQRYAKRSATSARSSQRGGKGKKKNGGRRRVQKGLSMQEREIVNAIGREYLPTIKELRDLFTGLPRLEYDRDTDLAVLEQSVQDVAGILQLPISPSLEQFEDRMIWRLE